MAVRFLTRWGKAADCYRGNSRGLCSVARSSSSNNSDPVHSDDHDEVLVEGGAHSRTAILNRPSSLNALNPAMGARLNRLYKSWEDDPDIGFVAMKGSGRAFCAGGDIVALHHLISQGKLDRCKEFFSILYNYIYLLGTYLKPNVALLNGITMGGGAGVSIPGMFRVATERTLFATPETLIGFHPDAGASFYLSHLPGHLGEYLALTGETLKGAEMIGCGLATHYTHSTETEASETNDPWCNSTLRRLGECSPLSLKVSLKSIREGRFQTLDQCLIREYRMSLQGISQHDFREGVRARMVDKDLAAKWNPPRLDQVTEDMVDSYFTPLSESEPDLELPTQQREAFTS
ncbi:3-hydroxyisobutyryl-CoA hydrolase-like protein 1, mitochondrial [Linum perenne]